MTKRLIILNYGETVLAVFYVPVGRDILSNNSQRFICSFLPP